MTRQIPASAIALIRDWEGLFEQIGPNLLRSYLCPSGIWTIGRGSTRLRGMPVLQSTRCTLAEAEQQFELDLEAAAQVVERLVTVELSEMQFGALVCLTQNIGSGSFRRSTLLRKLNGKEDAVAAMFTEFPRWVNDEEGKVLSGLVRRRQTELALLQLDATVTAANVAAPKAMIRLSDAAKHDKEMAQQVEAWRYLRKNAPPGAWDAFQTHLPATVVVEFARLFRGEATAEAPLRPAVAVPATVKAKDPAAAKSTNPLVVPFYSQRDNYRDSDRTCFSSTCAMALKFLKPEAIKGDDDYIRTVFSLGDTTKAAVQIQALARYGIKAVFRQDGTFDLIRRQIDLGYPVPFGWLHRGPVNKPQGGGHYALAIGYTAKGLVVHDPWGEADLITGATLNSQGRSLRYSYQNLGPRWMVSGNDGWCLVLSSRATP